MADHVTWTCGCGETSARVDVRDGTRAICYCDDCQAFSRVTDHETWLDEAGGSDLFQTTPDRIEMLRGAGNLAVLRLSDKGPLRWYVTCCGAPFANTLTTRQVPFSSLQVHGFSDPDAAGPVSIRVNRKFARARVEGKQTPIWPMVASFMKRAAAARLSGRHRQTPFFDDGGAPVAEVRRLTPEERQAAYAPPKGH